MKYIKGYLFLTLALLLLPIAAFAQEHLPVWVEGAKIDGTTVHPYEWNRLNLERGNEFELKLYLNANADAEDIEIDASFSGYEYDKVSAHLGSFDVEAGVTYVKKMKITLPEDMDLDEYTLRVIISDRNNYEQIYSYNLKIDAPRHELKLRDVLLSPNDNIMAGAGFVTKVRLENTGQKQEEDIKITVGLPELEVKASEYMDKIKTGDEKDSEEIFLRLPKCAEPGEYVVAVEAVYNNGHDKIAGFTKITVLENEKCKAAEEEQKIQIIVPQEPEQKEIAQVQPVAPAKTTKSLRTVLEIALIVLVALLIIVGFAIGFSRWRQEE